MYKQPIYWILVLILCFPAMVMAQLSKPFTVVIDAGHGGNDPGAIGKLLKEKDLNLNVALTTGRLIAQRFPEVKVVYTRDTDVFLPLQTRADIVNKNNADLFICIHTNAAKASSAHGVETFVLGTEKMEANLDVAMRENAVIKLESDYQTTYQGFDPQSIDSYIMFELMQNAYMDQSLRFAELVQRQLVGNLHREERGVRQAAFWVLLKSACPSVLIEMGFVSNPEEEKFLASIENQQRIATGIVDAFTGFYKPSSLQNKSFGADTAAVNQVVNTITDVRQTDTESPRSFYAVQVLASNEPVAASDSRLRGYQCDYVIRNGWYKYFIGCYQTNTDAVAKQQELKHDFPDCWVVNIQK